MFFVMKSINQSAELFTDSFYASHLMLLLTIFCPLNFLEHRIIHQRIISKWSYNVLFCCQASSMQYCDYCFTLTSNQSCPTLNCQSPLMHMSPLVTSFTIAQARNQKNIPTFLYLYTVPININISYLLYLHKCLSWVIFFHGATYHVCSWWPEASILSFFFSIQQTCMSSLPSIHDRELHSSNWSEWIVANQVISDNDKGRVLGLEAQSLLISLFC